MKLITVEQVIKFHYKMAEATGGMIGVRDLNLLKSAKMCWMLFLFFQIVER